MAPQYENTQTLRFTIPQQARGRPEAPAPGAVPGQPAPAAKGEAGFPASGVGVPVDVPAPQPESDYHQLFQSVYDAAVVVDLQGTIVEVNYRALGFFLHKREALCGRNVGQLISGAATTLMPELISRLAGRRFALIDAYCTRLDGSLFPAEIAVSYLPFKGQRCLCFFVRDITLRRQTEEMLRTEHCAILNAANGIAIANLEAKMDYVNPAGLEMWGYDNLDAVRGMDFADFLGNFAVASEIMDAVYHGRCWSGECQIMRHDGSSLHVQGSAAANHDADNEFVGMVFSFLDISKRKRAEEAQRLARAALEAANRELESKNTQFEQELQLARSVHLGFLPHNYPHRERLFFAQYYQACEFMGGDLFDVFSVAPNQVGIFMADVSGHGVSSALISGLLKMAFYSLRSPAAGATGGRAESDLLYPERALSQLGKLLNRELLQSKFITVAYAVINLDFSSCRYALAGHPPPLLYSVGSGTAAVCKSRLGMAIGFRDGIDYPVNEVFLNPGDKLLFYTDGITDALNGGETEFSLDRLVEVFRDHGAGSAEEIVHYVTQAVEEHRAGYPANDDMSLIVTGVRP